MSLKIEFVERAKEPTANISALCREYEISRETGHKWLKRFLELGYAGLEEKSRRPRSAPLSTAEDIVAEVLALREQYPTWGPTKLLGLLEAKFKAAAPSRATLTRILQRFALVRRRRRRLPRTVVANAPTVFAKKSNDVWTMDFKGWWRTGDGARCDPFTVRDAWSRYVLSVRIMEPTAAAVRAECLRLFRRYGRPAVIQTDNGEPFCSVQSRGGLTRLSAWWVALGIRVVRSRVGKPQDNGAHERMHRDIKAEVQSAPQANLRAEQRALDRWRQTFNYVRPHEALGGKTPAALYRPKASHVLLERRPSYPDTWLVKRAHHHGRLSLWGNVIHVGRAFEGHLIGIEPCGECHVRLWFHDIDLGEAKVTPPTAALDAATQKFWMRQTSPKRAKSR